MHQFSMFSGWVFQNIEYNNNCRDWGLNLRPQSWRNILIIVELNSLWRAFLKIKPRPTLYTESTQLFVLLYLALVKKTPPLLFSLNGMEHIKIEASDLQFCRSPIFSKVGLQFLKERHFFDLNRYRQNYSHNQFVRINCHEIMLIII